MGLAATPGGVNRFGLADFMFSYEPCALRE
jgi:hypothetical protein